VGPGEDEVRFAIVRRQFAKFNDSWAQLDDMRQRGLDVEQNWPSFCALVHGDRPDELATALRKQVVVPHIGIVPSPAAGSVWIVGAYYQLEKVLPALVVN
jgi:hypothetical protein